MQRGLGGNPWQRLHQEMGCTVATTYKKLRQLQDQDIRIANLGFSTGERDNREYRFSISGDFEDRVMVAAVNSG